MRKVILLAIATIAFLGSFSAQAGLITRSDTVSQTLAGQNFIFNFASLPLANAVDGSLRIQARGDYDSGTSTEFLTWDIDSLGIGSSAGPVLGGTTIIQSNFNDTEWFQVFTLTAANLLAITADGTASISIDLNGDQDAGVGVGFQPNEYVSVQFEYTSDQVNVPAPATLALMGLGLAGLGWKRRKQA
jgi:hypothetical protein